jgi:CNT family concentrative nucleoside transporter
MIIQSMAGLFVFSGIAWLISENRAQVKIKPVIAGIVIQLVIGFILLKLPVFRSFFISLNHLVLSLESSTKAGTSMVFGYLGGGNLPFAEKFPGSSFILAFQALPLILVISALSSLLFYWKILPLVVKSFSYALQKTLGLGGAEGLGVSANIFVGMVESPLFIRPYLREMTRSDQCSCSHHDFKNHDTRNRRTHIRRVNTS